MGAPAYADTPGTHVYFSAGSAAAVVPDFEPGMGFGAGLHGRTWGIRGDFLAFGFSGDHGQALIAASYELARTRRHFVIDGYFGGGATWPDPQPVLYAGIASRLGLSRRGPLYLGLAGGVHAVLDEAPFDVAFVSMTTIGLSW